MQVCILVECYVSLYYASEYGVKYINDGFPLNDCLLQLDRY